jgi:hypothetical protein
MVTCQVLIAEILRLRTHRSTWATGLPVRDEAQLLPSVQLVMATMATLAGNCPIISESLVYFDQLDAHLFCDRFSAR